MSPTYTSCRKLNRQYRDSWILGIWSLRKAKDRNATELQGSWVEVGAGKPQGIHVSDIFCFLSLLHCVSLKIFPLFCWLAHVLLSSHDGIWSEFICFSGQAAGREISSYSQVQIPGAGTKTWFGLDTDPWSGLGQGYKVAAGDQLCLCVCVHACVMSSVYPPKGMHRILLGV